MHKRIVLCFIILASYTHAQEFIFTSPTTSKKTALLTAGAGVGGACLTHAALATLLRVCEITEIPLNFFTTVAIPITNWLNLRVAGSYTTSIQNQQVIKGITFGLATVAGLAAAWLTYRYQPEGKFCAARDSLNAIYNDEVLTLLLTDPQQILKNIDRTYIESDFPRVQAHHEFVAYYSALKKASVWLKESIDATSDSNLIMSAREYISLCEQYIDILISCIEVIITDPSWLKQLKAYELQKSREAQEKLVATMAMNQWNDHHVFVHKG